MSRKSYLENFLSLAPCQAIPASSLTLLKKIVLLSHQGELSINGQCPDKQFSLADYLLDDRRLILDCSMLSESHQKDFHYWLHASHQLDLKPKFSAPYRIDESRGLIEEKRLNLWQSFWQSSLFVGQYYTHKLPNLSPEDEYTLKRIDLSFSKRGAIIDLVSNRRGKHRQEPLEVADEYLDDGYLQNVKRVVLTDEIVASLVHEVLNQLDLSNSLNEAHPNAIDVQNREVRNHRISEYRANKQYNEVLSFVWRIVALFQKWWFDLFNPTPEPLKTDYQPFCQSGDVSIQLCKETGQVLVLDKRVPIDALGLCGGGARIFSYLGVIDVLEEYSLKFKRYSGSSAGAIMASLLFLGYGSSELKAKFKWITDHLLMDYDIDLSGLSTTNKMRSALQYFILHRVQDEIQKHKKWFQSDEAKAFLREAVNPGKITFETIAKLKRICPDLNFAEELIITGTNTTLGCTEIFSLSTTPNMEIAEAVKISASLPVIYKPTQLGPYSYTDGGVLNNLPLDYFSHSKDQFLSHELSISLNVLALQFDTGAEHDAVYSQNPVYREPWVLNKLYGLLTKINDPVSAWVNDRLTLRDHGGQTILIDVKDIKATKFDIDDKARDALVESGRQAAKEYLDLRYVKQEDKYVNDEHLFATFENLEALIIYCGVKKKWEVLESISKAINVSTEISADYKAALARVGDALEMIKEQERLKEEGYKNRWRKLLPTLTGLSRMKVGAKQEQKDKSTIYCMLFPVLSQPWQALISHDLASNHRQQLNMLELYRKKLNMTDQVLVFNGLVDAMEANASSSHLFYYILKTLLVYARNEYAVDEVKYDVIRFTEIFSILKKSKVINVSELVNDWNFDVEDCQKLIKLLCEENYKGFFRALGPFYKSEFEWNKLSLDKEDMPYLRMVR